MYFLQFLDKLNIHNIISSYSSLNSTTTQPRQLKKGSHIKPVGTNIAHSTKILVPIHEKTEFSHSFFMHKK